MVRYARWIDLAASLRRNLRCDADEGVRITGPTERIAVRSHLVLQRLPTIL
jgi:hypothetical protein